MNKSFCAIPWLHLYVNTDGNTFPCCISCSNGDIARVGNINSASLADMLNSDLLSKLRVDMLNDVRRDDICGKCNYEDEHGFQSFRKGINIDFKHKIDELIADTDLETGKIGNPKILNWDFRFSNLCNLRCRTCGDHFSSSIAAENNMSPAKITWVKDDTSLNDIRAHYQDVERIYFAGGEPLIMEEHLTLLKELIAAGVSKKIKLIYNSNGTNLEYRKTNFLDLWKEFKHVAIGISIDHINDKAEYVRDGCDWQKLLANFQKLAEFRKQSSNFDFYIAFTLSIFNVADFAEIHKWFLDNKFIAPRNNSFLINMLVNPDWYNSNLVTNIPVIIARIEDYKQYLLNTYNFKFDGADIILTHLKHVSNKPNTIARETFKQVTAKLDAKRGQSFSQTFDQQFFNF